MPAKTNEELYEEAERQLIGEAIAETEQEIFDSAFDNGPDDNDGDTSLEQMDSDDVIDDDIETDDIGEDEAETEDDEQYPDSEEAPAAPEQEAQKTQRQGIPPARLRQEADARRAVETERDAARAEAREFRARLDNIERQRQAPPQQPIPQQGPDMFADPDGWAAAQREQIRQEMRADRVNSSMADAHDQHGDKFVAAYNALLSRGQSGDTAAVQKVWNAPNPGRELINWHQQQSLLNEIGNDPAAYRQKLRDELLSDPDFRKELISGMRENAINGDGGRARTNVRLPSLNGASGGSSHRGRDALRGDTARTNASLEREIFNSAFED